jgi:16S rRNA processing protein RimM
MSPEKVSTKNMNARQLPEFLAVGRIVRPHGVRGGFKVAADSDLIHKLESAANIYLGPEKVSAVVQTLRIHRKEFLLFIEGITTRDAAEKWRQTNIYIRYATLDPLPDGEFYHWQIVGLKAVATTGEELGSIEEIIQTGANDVYVVRSPSGKEIMLPAIESVIQDVDLANERIIVSLIPGLIE